MFRYNPRKINSILTSTINCPNCGRTKRRRNARPYNKKEVVAEENYRL